MITSPCQLQICSDFLFIHDLVLVGFMFIGMLFMSLGYLTCWWTIVHCNFFWLIVFLQYHLWCLLFYFWLWVFTLHNLTKDLMSFKKLTLENSLVVQWLGLCTFIPGGHGISFLTQHVMSPRGWYMHSRRMCILVQLDSVFCTCLLGLFGLRCSQVQCFLIQSGILNP